MIPLHWALGNGAPNDVIRALIVAFPAGVAVTDPSDGSLPIHKAAYVGCSSAVIETLIYLNPWSLDVFLKGSKYTPFACTELHGSFSYYGESKLPVQAALSQRKKYSARKKV